MEALRLPSNQSLRSGNEGMHKWEASCQSTGVKGMSMGCFIAAFIDRNAPFSEW